MSRIVYATTATGPHWCPDQAIFTISGQNYGPLSQRHGLTFAASAASAVLGPDLAMPGLQLPNVPTATGPIWNQLVAPPPPRPDATFVGLNGDTNYTWIRGHLINGRWGGPGNTWYNLTPLTGTANANHATVEGFIDSFIVNSLAYESAAYRTTWYGVYYLVRCSVAPFSHPASTNSANLYSYAPAFIKISWRAVSIVKPINQNVAAVVANLLGGVPVFAPVVVFPVGFIVPVRPAVMVGAFALPGGNVPGDPLLGAQPANFPAAQGNGFDGDIEIHQA